MDGGRGRAEKGVGRGSSAHGDTEKREHITFKEFPTIWGDQSREYLLEGGKR